MFDERIDFITFGNLESALDSTAISYVDIPFSWLPVLLVLPSTFLSFSDFAVMQLVSTSDGML